MKGALPLSFRFLEDRAGMPVLVRGEDRRREDGEAALYSSESG